MKCHSTSDRQSLILSAFKLNRINDDLPFSPEGHPRSVLNGSCLLMLLCALLLFGFPAPGWAQVDPFSKVGFEPTDAVHQYGNDTINPLTGLLVRNETIMGPFTAPHGYQYSLVAHYSGPAWRAYSKVKPDCSGSSELHRPNGYGALGVGWTMHMGVIHDLRQAVRQFSYESPSGEIIYFWPTEPGTASTEKAFESVDGKYRLIKYEVSNPDYDPEIPSQSWDKHHYFLMTSPEGTQFTFAEHAGTYNSDVTANNWNCWYLTQLKTAAGDVLEITYLKWEDKFGGVTVGTRSNLATISDGTRFVDFVSTEKELQAGGIAKKYILITGVDLRGYPGSKVEFSYYEGAETKTISSPLAVPSVFYSWHSKYTTDIAVRPRAFLKNIKYPEGLQSTCIYNPSGYLASFYNPIGGEVSYNYDLIPRQGMSFNEVLGAALDNYRFGGPDLACSNWGTSISDPNVPGLNSFLLYDISLSDNNNKVRYTPRTYFRMSKNTDDCVTSLCTQEVTHIVFDPISLTFHEFTTRETVPCQSCGGLGGGIPGGDVPQGAAAKSCYDGWVLRQTSAYGISTVVRDGNTWSYDRLFDDSAEVALPHRTAVVTAPDQGSTFYDYGGPYQGAADSVLLSDLDGVTYADNTGKLRDLQYLLDYIAGRPRNIYKYSSPVICQTEPQATGRLEETRYLYKSDFRCYSPEDYKYIWTLDVDNRTTHEATRRYNSTNNTDGFMETLTGHTVSWTGASDDWDSGNKTFKGGAISCRYLASNTANTPTSDQVIQNPALWKTWKTFSLQFEEKNSPEAIFPRIKEERIAGLWDGTTLLTEYITNSRGQTILDIKRENPVNRSEWDIVTRYHFGSTGTDGQIHRIEYFKGNAASMSDLPPPAYYGCGSVSVDGEPLQGGLPIADEPDTIAASTQNTGIGNAQYAIDFNWASGYPLSMKWKGIGYDEICRNWDSVRGLPTSDEDPNGIVTSYDWDNAGRLKTIVRQFGHDSETTSVTYSQSGKHIKVATCAEDDVVHYIYDAYGRLRETWKKILDDNSTSLCGGWSVQARDYDSMGRVHSKTGWFSPPAGACASASSLLDLSAVEKAVYAYDRLGRVTSITGPASFSQTIAYSGLNKHMTTSGITGQSGAISSTYGYYYDPLGRLAMVDAPEGADAVYSYNVAGQLTKARLASGVDDADYATYLSGGADSVTLGGAEQVRLFSYDNLGLLASETHPESGTTTFTGYDALGKALSYRTAKGAILTQQYDGKGRKTSVASSVKTLAFWTYDEPTSGGTSNGFFYGQLTSTQNFREDSLDTVKEYFKYNGNLGRLSQKATTILGNSYQANYSYDACGRQVLENAILGSSTTPLYQTSFNTFSAYYKGMLSQRYFRGIADYGRVGEQANTIKYNPSSSPRKLPFYFGQSQHLFDTIVEEEPGLGRIKGISVTSALSPSPPCGGLLWQVGPYNYDPSGNIESIADQTGCGGSIIERFCYDAAQRLRKAEVTRHDYPSADGGYEIAGPVGIQYDYDIFGNLTNKDLLSSGSAMPYLSFDEYSTLYKAVEYHPSPSSLLSRNRVETHSLPSSSDPVIAGCAVTVKHDLNGNMTEISQCNPINYQLKMEYDPLNRLTKALLPGGCNYINYYCNADGERVGSVTYYSKLALCKGISSSYYLRSGPQVVAQEDYAFNGSVTTSNPRRSFMYIGRDLAATQVWDQAAQNFTATLSGETPNIGGGSLCPVSYLRPDLYPNEWHTSFIKLSDPSVSSCGGQNCDTTFYLRGVTADLAGAMVRLARIKDNGDGGSSGEGNGNGDPRSDEDRVECLYFLADGLDSDFVFQRFGLRDNQGYGAFLPLSGDSPALFSALQTDKSYRVTLYLWTSLGADINLGYNRVLMEEGRLMLPKQHPAKFLSAKYCEEADEDGKVKTFLRAAWDQMDDPRVASYDVIGADAGGNRLTLNDGPIFCTSWEASKSSLEAKGLAAGGPLSVEASLAGTTEVLSLGPIWQVEAVTCYGASNAQATTTPPNGLVAINVKVGNSKRAFLKWSAGTKWVKFRVYRANATCASADWATASLLSSTVTNRYYNDLGAPQTGTCAFRVVGVDSLGNLSAACECAQVDMSTSGILQQPANLLARNDSPAGTYRLVNITWDPMQSALQSAGFKFRIDYASKASDTTTTDCNLISALYAKLDGQVGQAYKTHDFAVASPSANPLNSYRVAIIHPDIIDTSTNAPALLSPWGACDMTHAAECTPGPQAVTVGDGNYNPMEHTLTFAWPAASCNSPCYWVYKGIADSGGELVARVDTPSYTFSSSQLPPPNNIFTMTVVVVNKNTGCRSIPSGKGFFIPDTGCAVVTAPTTVSATASASTRTVSVAWAASNCGATGPCTYKILRRLGTGAAAPTTICESAAASPFVDSAPPFDTLLYYSVIAVDAKGCRSPESQCSSAVTVPLPPAPEMKSISGQMNVINLSWYAVPGASYYIIYRGLGSCGSAQETDTAPYSYYQDAVTSSGATYYYKVAAVFDFQGAPSYTTPPSATCLSWIVPLLTSSYEANGAKPATRFYIHDHLGSTRLVLDSAGQIVSSHDFEPFGVEIPPYNDISGNTHKFTGYERDTLTGLDNAHARQMMPSYGRFASPDKLNSEDQLKTAIANPQVWNAYSFTINNPLRFVDPDGHWFFPWELADAYSATQSNQEFQAAYARYWDNPDWGTGVDALTKLLAASYDLVALAAPVLPAVGGLSQKGIGLIDNAIGFAAGTGRTALTADRLQHASHHLIEAGVLPRWNKETANQFVNLAERILEKPLATFDHTLKGNQPARGFLGQVGDKPVVIFVYKDGPLQGKVATSVVPSQKQLEKWLVGAQ